jgi:hypothetical protein
MGNSESIASTSEITDASRQFSGKSSISSTSNGPKSNTNEIKVLALEEPTLKTISSSSEEEHGDDDDATTESVITMDSSEDDFESDEEEEEDGKFFIAYLWLELRLHRPSFHRSPIANGYSNDNK